MAIALDKWQVRIREMSVVAACRVFELSVVVSSLNSLHPQLQHFAHELKKNQLQIVVYHLE